MSDRVIDPKYLAYQYGDSEKLRIRIEAHERYSERADTVDGAWQAQFVARLCIGPGQRLLDVGCGFGSFHPTLCATGADVLGFDLSGGLAREAAERARQAGLAVQVIRADAQAIPLADKSCDAALASHMLFHVPDIRQALVEMRRVVKLGGRVLATTNASDHSARLHDLHRQAARDLGLTPTERSGFARFTLDDLPLVRSVFPNVEVYRQPNAFVFPTVDSALRYYASGRVDDVLERRDDGSHRSALMERMGELIGEIIAREGIFRVPKDSGSFLATVTAP